MSVSAVILAGGSGTRFGSRIPKALMSLNGKPVMQWAIDVIEPHVVEIVVVADEPYRNYLWAPPGASRSESARSGLQASTGDTILIHDGARPFLTDQIIRNVLDASRTSPSVDTAVPITDGYLEDGIPKAKRGRMLGQTPEVFWREPLEDAFAITDRDDWDDEASMVHAILGLKPVIVEGVTLNTKITYAKDLENAEAVMRYWTQPPTSINPLHGRLLVLGGTGGIGKAVLGMVGEADAPPRAQLDLASDFEVDLSPYAAVLHTAGEYADESRIMAVNFDSMRRLTDLALAQGWEGNMVVVSSTAATFGRPGIALYSASKAALNAWIEASHGELAVAGIRLNAVAPAKVNTRLQQTINPDADPAGMLTPGYVAERILPYLNTRVHGHITYLRVGFDTARTREGAEG